ncbi:MAG: tRNA (uridine(34)/cytosine(34)/5-carboxymethylaminomethyluridine(34)-2'-O)-methyltransferase TrmL [Bacillota bacterium]|nr:tRNA (uridine(34)/cytosine(34)/5-carboxymethylaminomethyluridine(34)-2'-O)-methyltransferase TrmL [Bacillota bacterium]HHU30290.1 tRNA (uridine(34)/cytosine(34)/5-carboxymethylaminomethyluridine(34)-2'-O)-methyltransferase TrmL [Bacillota bacterium]
MHVVLVEPEIPPNTGNVSRTCAVTGTILHLVEPLGFSLDERHLRRAGLDYWDRLQLVVHKSLEAFFQWASKGKMWFFTTSGSRLYTDVAYGRDDYLLFGKETAGLPKWLLEKHPKQCLRIPMGKNIRSLNLSNSVAIVLYEALRQQGFPGLY